jgi:hypothetical protein
MKAYVTVVLALLSILYGGCEGGSSTTVFPSDFNVDYPPVRWAYITMHVEPDSIALGDSVVVTWDIASATECLLTVSTAPDSPTRIESSGRLVFWPTTNTIYSFKAKGTGTYWTGKEDSVRLGPWRYRLTTHFGFGGYIMQDRDSADYLGGTAVKLTAIAFPGWIFAGWDDGTSLSFENPRTQYMWKDEVLEAKFQQLR